MIAFLTLGELGVLGANPFRAGEQTRAKGAKDAKFKGIKQDEIAQVVVEWAFALHKELGPGLLRNWMIKGRISDRLSNPWHPWRPWRPWREPLSGRGTDSRKGRKGQSHGPDSISGSLRGSLRRGETAGDCLGRASFSVP